MARAPFVSKSISSRTFVRKEFFVNCHFRLYPNFCFFHHFHELLSIYEVNRNIGVLGRLFSTSGISTARYEYTDCCWSLATQRAFKLVYCGSLNSVAFIVALALNIDAGTYNSILFVSHNPLQVDSLVACARCDIEIVKA